MSNDKTFTGKPLQDTDPMPFGKHKGTPMQEVPASYLHWLWTNGIGGTTGPVETYIKENMGALRKDHPDGIWEL